MIERERSRGRSWPVKTVSFEEILHILAKILCMNDTSDIGILYLFPSNRIWNYVLEIIPKTIIRGLSTKFHVYYICQRFMVCAKKLETTRNYYELVF